MNQTRNDHALINILRMNQTQIKNNAISEKQKNSPVKKFLLTRSKLVKFNEIEKVGGKLSKNDEKKQNRISELRDKAFSKIQDEIKKYYEAAIDGDYRFDGMPAIGRGIRGWIEAKVWRLLVEIGEPGHDEYWKEEV